MDLLRAIHGWSGFSDPVTVMVIVGLLSAIAVTCAWLTANGRPRAGVVSWVIGPVGIYLLWRAFQAVNPGSHISQWMLLLFLLACLLLLIFFGVADSHLAAYLMTGVFALAAVIALINVIVGYTSASMPAFLS